MVGCVNSPYCDIVDNGIIIRVAAEQLSGESHVVEMFGIQSYHYND